MKKKDKKNIDPEEILQDPNSDEFFKYYTLIKRRCIEFMTNINKADLIGLVKTRDILNEMINQSKRNKEHKLITDIYRQELIRTNNIIKHKKEANEEDADAKY